MLRHTVWMFYRELRDHTKGSLRLLKHLKHFVKIKHSLKISKICHRGGESLNDNNNNKNKKNEYNPTENRGLTQRLRNEKQFPKYSPCHTCYIRFTIKVKDDKQQITPHLSIILWYKGTMKCEPSTKKYIVYLESFTQSGLIFWIWRLAKVLNSCFFWWQYNLFKGYRQCDEFVQREDYADPNSIFDEWLC